MAQVNNNLQWTNDDKTIEIASDRDTVLLKVCYSPTGDFIALYFTAEQWKDFLFEGTTFLDYQGECALLCDVHC